jgi:hypothetical protein
MCDVFRLSQTNYDQTDENSPYLPYYKQNSPGYRLPVGGYPKGAPYSTSHVEYRDPILNEIGN